MMPSLCHKTILIIDDDLGMLRPLDKVLAGQGATVLHALWAGDAVEVLTRRQKQIDLVITYLRMPVLPGMTVVHAIHEVFPALPVIVLTALDSADVKAECLWRGAAAFLEKPLDTPHLLNIIEAVCPGGVNGA